MNDSQSLLSPNVPQPRAYQSAIAHSVLTKGSTLVVLPTGMGKTLVALLVAAEKLKEGRVLFLAPTKPLAKQHEKTCRDWLNLQPDEILLVSGEVPAKKRKELYLSPARLILSTPQTIANDLEKGRLEWKNFSLVVFDECHRAVGKYAYTAVAKAAIGEGPLAPKTDIPAPKPALVLGLTASPGGQKKRIEDILATLGISNVEIRSTQDADVAPYIKPLEIEWVEVQLSAPLLDAQKVLQELIGQQVATLRKMGFIGGYISKKGLSEWRMKILQSGSHLRFSALSHHATLFSLVHTLELLETQGVEAFRRFVRRMKEREPSKASLRLLGNKQFMALVEKMESAAEHPKIEKLVEILKKRPVEEKSIVFCQYRDQVQVLVEVLKKNNLRAEAFMGKKEGVTAKGQAKTIEDFRAGAFDILVATSIGEEGLDIPSVDNVIFYEPVPSEIRTIQRRGRAGRAKMGRMMGLIAAGTRDTASFWSARRREEKMHKIVGKMSGRQPHEIQKTPWVKITRSDAVQPEQKKGEPAAQKKEEPAADKKEKNRGKTEKTASKNKPVNEGQSTLGDF